ncbi:hypothetical protein RvY_05560-2 [Ramazzottius varieornatus]|uniref:Uncharacterized protein n=1 Tax=Ramazzottius varieornatus TaxID=947166 RepID=A0A1D1V5A7_RAMVA|nr:hypothetical protein RvY_05560-2 [Ramazzottius varieornatus]
MVPQHSDSLSAQVGPSSSDKLCFKQPKWLLGIRPLRINLPNRTQTSTKLLRLPTWQLRATLEHSKRPGTSFRLPHPLRTCGLPNNHRHMLASIHRCLKQLLRLEDTTRLLPNNLATHLQVMLDTVSKVTHQQLAILLDRPQPALFIHLQRDTRLALATLRELTRRQTTETEHLPVMQELLRLIPANSKLEQERAASWSVMTSLTPVCYLSFEQLT